MIATEYGKAIFELSCDYDVLEQTIDEFNIFVSSLQENTDYVKVLTYPRINKKEKKESLKNVYKDFSSLFMNFLYVLIDKDRMNIISDIYDEFSKIVYEHKNILNAQVLSALELTDSQINNLENQLKKYFKVDKVNVLNKVDSNLIGGIKIFAKGEALDFTLSGKLESLKSNF